MEINIVHFRHLWNEAGTQVNAEPYLLFDVVIRNLTGVAMTIIGCEGRATVDGDICTLPPELVTDDRPLTPWTNTIPVIKQPFLRDKGVELVSKVESGEEIKISLGTIRLIFAHSDQTVTIPPIPISLSFSINPTGITLERDTVTKRLMVMKNP